MTNQTFELGSVGVYHYDVAKKIGVYAAVIFGHLQNFNYRHDDNWFAKPIIEISKEVGLSTHDTRKACRILKENGLIDMQVKRTGASPAMHFRLTVKITE